jgi:hypothetical protein
LKRLRSATWLAAQPLLAQALEQVAVGLSLIDAICPENGE